MTKEKFELPEEFEILIAQRLLGEISHEDNQKLEHFFKENPTIKKAYFEKEGVKRLLSNAADNLEKLQLPEGKRNYLLKLAEPKKSGRIILVTYSIAATVFFSFMIGLYFYTNHLFQEKEGVLSSYHHIEKSISATNENERNLPSKADIPVPKEKNEPVAVAKPTMPESPKSKGTLKDLKKDMFDEIEEADAKEAKTAATSNVDGSIKEIAIQEKEEFAIGEEKSHLKSKIDASQVNEVGSTKYDAKNEKETPLFKKRANELEDKSEKVDSLSIVADKKKTDKDRRSEFLDVSEEVVSEQDGLSFLYLLDIQFNGQKQSKSIFSAIDLNLSMQKEKMSLKHLLELTGLNRSTEQKNEIAKKLSVPLVSVKDKKSNNLAEAKKENIAPEDNAMGGKPSVSKENSVQVKEFLLVYTCYIAYQSRNNLSRDSKTKLLEEIKKVLNGLLHFNHDEMLKTWLLEVEKELK